MGKLDKDGGKSLKLTRRQFLQAGAATAAVGAAGLDFAAKPSSAAAAEVAATYHTTCPYCSASCGQLVDVDAEGNVLDIYGDHNSPWNRGGLCSKGAGSYQLVNNPRRVGAWAGSHPVNNTFAYDPTYADGIAYKRTGNGPWEKMSLDAALNESAAAMVAARGDLAVAHEENNSDTVAFFGSSHINNDQNYLYRKIIANFGTSNVEHQARI
ncbi:MAG: twin-arginine translocation signal domain-containing protein [Anaerosomatales bacterium]|nr:twin-arginine translocation signal domain-containing protein [Anaerosomatales bacterium]MDT8434092.1 twin-arginine translocation signal domain-containing protein [Anaerosomatales bacterium]